MKKYLFILTLLVTQLMFAQQDCVTAIPVCRDSDIALTPGGVGNVEEAETGGCLSGESNSLWLTFSVETAGTLTFVITPTGPGANNIDYDWALYGPNHNCANVNATPLRCSYAGSGSAFFPVTGLNMTATDTTENAGGDGFVKYIDVLPGQVYYLLLNNFSPTIAPFSLSFGGTATLLTPFDNSSAQVYQPYPFLEPGENQDGEITICSNPATFDFSTLSAQILNNNTNFVVKYYRSATDALDDFNPITTPIVVNAANTYTYAISYVDPTQPTSFLNQCREFNTINFLDKSFQLTPVTLTECSNNNTGTATYDLTAAAIGATPNLTLQYYPSMAALNAGTSQITVPYAYTAAAGSVFVKATNEFDCVTIVEIKLTFHPTVSVTEATLRACFIEGNPSTGVFNLESAVVNLDSGTTKEYYPSETDAINQTNKILNFGTYTAPNGVVYVRVMNGNGCYTVAKVTLIVIPPVYSTVLVDKVICMEDKTTLDAGPGFDGYEWSNGETTQSISDVGVGTYWVKLQTGDCWAKQEVKIFPSEQPVVSNIEISNNTITVFTVGGTPAYSYSLDNNNWQDSNIFKDLSRGDHTIFVKDAYDCEPIVVNVVVPNIINVITPNGDGINDVIDYSALSNKKNLILNIYDRYGTKIHQADKMNNFKWDGTVGGKKVPTGTYWYSVTWNENNKNSTPIKFSGWVMLKNRE